MVGLTIRTLVDAAVRRSPISNAGASYEVPNPEFGDPRSSAACTHPHPSCCTEQQAHAACESEVEAVLDPARPLFDTGGVETVRSGLTSTTDVGAYVTKNFG